MIERLKNFFESQEWRDKRRLNFEVSVYEGFFHRHAIEVKFEAHLKALWGDWLRRLERWMSVN
jgi:hypothetical protein